MRWRQFLDNYRIWKRNYKISGDDKYRVYEKGDWKYILYSGFKGLILGLIFLGVVGAFLFSIV